MEYMCSDYGVDSSSRLSAFSTYVHGEAQTPLVRFVVDMFYKKIATNPQQTEPLEFEALSLNV